LFGLFRKYAKTSAAIKIELKIKAPWISSLCPFNVETIEGMPTSREPMTVKPISTFNVSLMIFT
jgi:hypothetical protein